VVHRTRSQLEWMLWIRLERIGLLKDRPTAVSL